MALTQLQNLVNPEIYAPMVAAELTKALRFTPLAQVDTTLQGSAGNTLTVSRFEYMGDAAYVAEGMPIPLDELGTNTAQVTIRKIAKGTSITDEAVLSGLGDPIGESTRQLGLALANTVDTALLNAALDNPTQTATVTANVDGILAGLGVFNDDGDYPYVAVMSPKNAAKVRSSANAQMVGSETGANSLISGTYFNVYGTQIVRSRKVPDNKIIFFKVTPASPALKLLMKQGVSVESERHSTNDTTIITAREHFAAYVYDPSKIVVATVSGESAGTVDGVFNMDGTAVPTASQTKGQIQAWLKRHGVESSEINGSTKDELLSKVTSVSTSESTSESLANSQSENGAG